MSIVPLISFIWSMIQSMPFRCRIFLVFLNLGQFLSFSFMTRRVLKITGQLVCRMPLSLSYSDGSSWLNSVMSYNSTEVILCPLEHRMLMWLIRVKINFDPVVKMLSARFHKCKVTHFPFVINKSFVRRYFETMYIPDFSLYFRPLILSFVDGTSLQKLLL